MAAILMISACFLLQLWPLSTATCSTRKECQSEFYNATFDGDLGYVETALCSTIMHIDPNVPNDQGITPLIIAAQLGHKSVVQALVNHGASLDLTENSTGATALYYAASFNQTAVARVLLLAGAVVNVRKNGSGYTPLMVATQKGYEGVVKALVEKRVKNPVELELTESSIGATALYLAAQYNQAAVARVLLLAGANGNVRVENAWTPLMKAARNGHVGVVQALVEKPVNLELRSNDSAGYTSLYLAAGNNKVGVTRALLRAGAKVNGGTNKGTTPLMVASQQYYYNVVQVLLTADEIDVNLTRTSGHEWTALHFAANHNKKTAIVGLLLKNGADKTKLTTDGKTPAELAGEKGNINVKRIIEDF